MEAYGPETTRVLYGDLANSGSLQDNQRQIEEQLGLSLAQVDAAVLDWVRQRSENEPD